MFKAWHDIDSFAHVLRARNQSTWMKEFPEPILYAPKIKLHGTNAGVRVTAGGQVIAQGRNRSLSIGDDNFGFAAFVEGRKNVFTHVCWNLLPDSSITFFGEWFGPGVQKGVASSEVKEKVFGVFALQVYHGEEEGVFIHEPADIERWLGGSDDRVRVLPWASAPVAVDFNDPNSMASFIETVNAAVGECEKIDPWIAKEYGIEGPGEGFVYYATNGDSPYLKGFMFKAKGEAHRVNKTKQAAQVDPERLRNVAAYADYSVTEARLEQAFTEAVNRTADPKLTGDFLRWVANDILKECTVELVSSGLEWKQVAGEISKRARDWFLRQV